MSLRGVKRRGNLSYLWSLGPFKEIASLRSQWQKRKMSLRGACDVVISVVPRVNEIASLRSQLHRLLRYARNDW